MKAPSVALFRDIRMPRLATNVVSHERLMLDTLAERRVEEEPKAHGWLRTMAARARSRSP
ncbi:MAG TPA: hypothetical protein VFH78_00035 [Candidatus Thermoplasmatota archaeon]|nr:hypothetical protein [Candidatus Thermoplasmatota archaeon]